MATFNKSIYLSSNYRGLYHLKGKFLNGELQSVTVAKPWVLDDFQSYGVGSISTLSGAIGFPTAPTVTYGSASITTYTDPQTGLTKKCLEMSPTGCEITFPLTHWAPLYQIHSGYLMNVPDTGGTLNCEFWDGYCKNYDGGPSNANTLLFFGHKWANGVGGFGTYEPLARTVDPFGGGGIYYAMAPHVRRRAFGTSDYSGSVSGTGYLHSYGGSNPFLKRGLWGMAFDRNPVWWYMFRRFIYGNLASNPKQLKDADENMAMRLGRFTSISSTGPPWLGGNQMQNSSYGHVLPYLVNGEPDHAVLYYREQTGTYPLRIYFLSWYLAAIAPQPA